METKKQLEEKKHQAAKTRDAKIAAYYKEHGSNKLSRDPSAVGKIKADYERTASRLDKRIDRIEQTAKVAGAVADLEAKYFELTGGGHSRMQAPTADLDDTAAAHAGYFQLNDRLGATRSIGDVWAFVAGARLAEIGSSFLGKQFAKWAGQGAAKTANKIDDAAKAVEDFLGGTGKIIKNADGDTILMRADKKIRFDVKDPHGDKPHFHLEQKTPGGKWQDAGSEHRYYLQDSNK